MSEWQVNGNRPPKFEGDELTDRQQEMYDQMVAVDNLEKFVGENCQSCMNAKYLQTNRIGRRVVEGTISKEEGILEMVNYTRECPGPESRGGCSFGGQICPMEEQEKYNSRTHCWD